MTRLPLKSALCIAAGVVCTPLEPAALGAGPDVVDHRYSPPEWQTSICLPDDPQKTLVDRSGELLYHYGEGGREFATRIGVEVVEGAVWEKQGLGSARAPIVRTVRSSPGLEIVEEAFAVTDVPQPAPTPNVLQRVDGGGVNRDWAHPPAGVDATLKDIALHNGGSIRYELAVADGGMRWVALALCEGWWKEKGKRVQVLRVEGAPSRTVDTVADIGHNRAGVYWFEAKDANGDGRVEIGVEPAAEAGDKNAILNGLWVFAGEAKADTEALLAGRLNPVALARLSSAGRGGPARNDVILVHVTNRGSEARTVRPRLVVDTTFPLEVQEAAQRLTVDGHETVTASLKMRRVVEEKGKVRKIELEELKVPAGGEGWFSVLYSGGGSIVTAPGNVEAAALARERAAAFWEAAPLPFGRVQVPDPGIQGLVDSSIRNIWQAREIKNGLPVFQVGPTCYRGLWIVDGAFLLEAAAMMGAGKEARSGIAYTLSQQKPSGAFEVLSPHYYKENGIVLWTCVRHALLTQDKAWLESVWPRLERAAGYILELRKRSLENDTPLDDGLNPPGEIDGGLSGEATGFKRPEFSNVHWNLIGLRAFVQAAQWLNKPAVAARWEDEFVALTTVFLKAAARDLRKDDGGRAYVPIYMANAGPELPQRAQWTFCHAVYPGQLFDSAYPLVGSTLAMLEATEREGMVYGTGWDASGLWNYFASFYGHAWLWQGRGQKAAEVLYAFANHASPTLVWREEQSLQGQPFKKVGDMPHNWASAEFLRLVVHLLALDRGDELHLLEGLPASWCGPGMVTRLNGVATPFGPLHMTLEVAQDGKTAKVSVRAVAPNCRAVIVHLPDGTRREVSAGSGGNLTFALPAKP